ncbi:hypothetical protein BKA70DRAFT_1293270 [Coprinopsis sp. MPI-PUGE-AT-0042]|nr:hypothetical protein BKA70DRAFT_1293270 [Coprinopsis sp. MPI-PUGE-AT-0042]
MAPHLPNELFREIVDHLSKYADISTLQAASLANSVFRVPCQTKLFSIITVNKKHDGDDDHHLTGLKSFAEAALCYPTSEKSMYNMRTANQCLYCRLRIQTWSTSSTYLRLHHSSKRSATVDGMEKTTLVFHQAIMALIRSPRLASLTLVTAPHQLASVAESTFLQHLTLADNRALPAPNSQMIKTMARKIHVTSLFVEPEAPTITFLTEPSSFDMSTVEELWLYHSTSRADWLLLMPCATSLRRLLLDVDAIAPWRFTPTLPNSLSSLSNLEDLVIDWSVDNRPYGINQHAALAFFLKALPSPSSISFMMLGYIFPFTDPGQGQDIMMDSWDEADAVLCDRTRFPEVEQLIFEVHFSEPPDTPSTGEGYEEIVEERFWRKTRSAGVPIKISDVVFNR